MISSNKSSDRQNAGSFTGTKMESPISVLRAHNQHGKEVNGRSGIIMLSADFTILTVNSFFQNIFLDAFGTVLRSGINLFASRGAISFSDRLGRWEEFCSRALRGIPSSEEIMLPLVDRNVYLNVHFEAHSWDQSSNVVSIFAEDISNSMYIRQELIKRDLNSRAILNSLPGCTLLIGSDRKLVDFNEKAADMFLASYGTVLKKGEDFLGFLPHELSSVWESRIWDAIERGDSTYLDQHLVCGNEMVCETKVAPIVGRAEVTGLVLYTEDVTQKKADELTRELQFQELKRLSRELDQFVYSASHDLRAPLLSIKGLVNIIRSAPEPNFDTYVDYIETSIDRLDLFVGNIVNYSKVNRLKIKPEKIDFNRLMTEIMASLNYLPGLNLVKSKYRIKSTGSFYSDKVRLMIILKNILSNAFQYFDTSKDRCELKVDIQSNTKCAIITVKDNGIGISENTIGQVFDMFYRGTERSTGAGLGLYIVKYAVERLNGEISLKSIYAKGTTLEVTIPSIDSNSSI